MSRSLPQCSITNSNNSISESNISSRDSSISWLQSSSVNSQRPSRDSEQLSLILSQFSFSSDVEIGDQQVREFALNLREISEEKSENPPGIVQRVRPIPLRLRCTIDELLPNVIPLLNEAFIKRDYDSAVSFVICLVSAYALRTWDRFHLWWNRNRSQFEVAPREIRDEIITFLKPITQNFISQLELCANLLEQFEATFGPLQEMHSASVKKNIHVLPNAIRCVGEMQAQVQIYCCSLEQNDVMACNEQIWSSIW